MFLKEKEPQVIVAGASGRWLAQSCNAAGLPVSVIDLFGDEDTVAACEQSQRHTRAQRTWGVQRCKSMADVWRVLIDTVNQCPVPPRVIPCGGMEHVPDGLPACRWSAVLPTSPGTRLARTVVGLRTFSDAFQFQMPETISADEFQDLSAPSNRLDRKKSWLMKNSGLSGGFGVQYADATTAPTASNFLQENISGRSISGCFVATRSANGPIQSRLLGGCEAWTQPTPQMQCTGQYPFRYRGSIGPLESPADLSESAMNQIRQMGEAAAQHFELTGLFGIDFVLDASTIWLLEVNPRVPASAELIERSVNQHHSGFSVAQLHLDAVAGQTLAPISRCAGYFSKRVVYTDENWASIDVDQQRLARLNQCVDSISLNGDQPTADLTSVHVTDLPALGSSIGPLTPVLTLHTQSHCLGRLRTATEKLHQRVLTILEPNVS